LADQAFEIMGRCEDEMMGRKENERMRKRDNGRMGGRHNGNMGECPVRRSTHSCEQGAIRVPISGSILLVIFRQF
jgi:hypothetical protein